MKILVTGGLGFIGHHVVHMLEQTGHEVVITDTQTTYGIVDPAHLQWLIDQRRRQIQTDRIYRIDIADQAGMDWLIRTHRADVVVHMASFPRQKVVNANPQLGSRSMSEGLLNLLEACSQNHVTRFVYVSSSMVYGDFVDGVTETHLTQPIGQYGIMKLAGEWLTRDYTRRTGMSHTIIRPSAVYGPLDVEDRVVSKFLTAAINKEIISVNGAAESLDFTYVTDAACGIAQASVSPQSCNKTYNITRGQSRTLLEAAELCIQIAQGGSLRVNDPDSNFPSRGQLNISQAQQDFGYQPNIDIEQGFKLYYDWLANTVHRNPKTV